MYLVQLVTGCLLSIVGLLTTIYFLYLSKQLKPKRSTHFLTSQSISTLLTGFFYVYASLSMSNLLLEKPPKSNLNLFDLIEETNSTSLRENREVTDNSDKPMCKFLAAYLREAMLVYSFIQGIISLLATALECRECLDKKEKAQTSSSDKTPRLVLQTLAPYLLVTLTPAASLTSLYFIMHTNSTSIDWNPSPLISQQQVATLNLEPVNIPTSSNISQINDVVANIYRLLKDNTSSGLDLNFDNQSEVAIQCNKPNLLKKLFGFALFIVGFSLALLYTQTVYMQTKHKQENNFESQTLKKTLLGFSLMWLPSSLEMFTRTHLTHDLPGQITDLMLLTGNTYNVLTNIGNALLARRLVKDQNNVQPAQ